MTEEGVPADVRDFLLACIDSVAELEALLLLRESPGQDWDAAMLARRLYVGEAEGAKILEHLVQCELAARTPAGFRYHVRDDERQRQRAHTEPSRDQKRIRFRGSSARIRKNRGRRQGTLESHREGRILTANPKLTRGKT